MGRSRGQGTGGRGQGPGGRGRQRPSARGDRGALGHGGRVEPCAAWGQMAQRREGTSVHLVKLNCNIKTYFCKSAAPQVLYWHLCAADLQKCEKFLPAVRLPWPPGRPCCAKSVGVWVCGCVGLCVCVGVWVCGCVGVWVCGPGTDIPPHEFHIGPPGPMWNSHSAK